MAAANPSEARWHELRPIIDEELERLPERYQAPLVLCYLEGKTHEQAARELNCPIGSISWRLEKGCTLLRGRLARRGVALSAAGFAMLLGEIQAPAAVAAGLVHATVVAAEPFAAGNLAGVAVVSTQAVVLAQGVLRLMMIAKLKVGISVLVALAGVIAVAGIFAGQPTTHAGPAAVVQPNDSEKSEPAPVAREEEVAKTPVEPPAEEPMRPVTDVGMTQVEFVRALRAKGYLDLALDYLSMIERKAPADMIPILALEKANIFVDLAATEPNPDRRSKLYDRAHGEFQALIKRYRGQPPAAIAQLEAARIPGLQYRRQLGKVRFLAPPAQIKEANRIEQLAIQAMTELEKAGDELDEQAKKKDLGRNMEKALDEARVLSDLQLAINQIDQAVTHQPQNKPLLPAGKRIERAIRDLDALSKSDPQGASGALARAWLVKAYSEIDQIKEAKQAYDRVASDNSPQAENARRIAHYFYFMMLAAGPNLNPIGVKAADAPRETQKVGEAWMRSYSAHLNSFEGISLRFELATSYQSPESLRLPNKDARALVERALRLYDGLAETDFTKEVEENRTKITRLEELLR